MSGTHASSGERRGSGPHELGSQKGVSPLATSQQMVLPQQSST